MTDWALMRVRRAAVPRPSEQLSALGVAIRQRRQVRGITQVRLAELAGIGRQQVCRLERGHWAPRLDTLWRIAAALRTCPSALLGDAEDALDGGGRAVE